jgi:curli biogenesis system outer membrane secretion channel CsgG
MRSVFLASTIVLLAATTGCGTIPTETKVTATEGQTIEEAQFEPYDGPKARMAVSRFAVKAAKAQGVIGEGVADMLATALFQTNRYIVLERQALGDVLAEQDLSVSGRVEQGAAVRMGKIQGAELLIMGSVTEFEPGSGGVGAGAGAMTGGAIGGMVGWLPGYAIGSIIGGIAGSIQTSHVAIDLKIVETKTSRVVAATSVEGKATDIAGMAAFGGSLGVGLSAYAKTPMEKAVRDCIKEAVKFVVGKTPQQYYRFRDKVTPAGGSAIGATAAPASPAKAQALPAETPPFVFVKISSANVREGPGSSFKVLTTVNKGAKLPVLERKRSWYRVKLEDGKEGWIAHSVVSLQPDAPKAQ